MDKENIETAGIWIMRIILVCGAIVGGLMGNYEVASTCGGIVFISFFFL